MEKIRHIISSWKWKLDGIWQEEKPKQEKLSFRKRTGAFLQEHKWEVLFVLLMGCLLFFLSWILPFDEGPDEKMRYMIPTYIYRHGTLPAGWEEEIRSKIWGISYAFHPILPYIFGGYLMKLVSIFNASEHALLMAARFINILFGMGFYWYVLQIAGKMFKKNIFRVYFVALLAMLPQLLYLFTYVNTDGIALFSTAMILYYWLIGMESRWNHKSCRALAIALSFCALSYFNAYGFALFSVVIFIGSMIVFYHTRGAKECTVLILKRGIYIAVIVFLLTGWWFIRCAILYDGDFLGLYAPAKYGELYAMTAYKPSVKQSLMEQGISLGEMLRSDHGGMEWIRTSYRTTIGYFGYYKHALGLDIYEIHKKLFALGLLGLFLQGAMFVLYYAKKAAMGIRKRTWSEEEQKQQAQTQKQQEAVLQKPGLSLPECKMHPVNFCLLQFSLGCCIIIPVLLSLYYSYTDDFQPQGRYMMPMIIPLMYFVAAGTERFMTLFFRKWFVWVMMLPLFYAILHVFLGAFVSVYIPSYYEPLAAWASIRFDWLSNNRFLVKLMYLLIPG